MTDYILCQIDIEQSIAVRMPVLTDPKVIAFVAATMRDHLLGEMKKLVEHYEGQSVEGREYGSDETNARLIMAFASEDGNDPPVDKLNAIAQALAAAEPEDPDVEAGVTYVAEELK